MRTQTLLAIVAVVVVLALGAVVLLADGEGALVTWLKGLHGAPAGRH